MDYTNPRCKISLLTYKLLHKCQLAMCISRLKVCCVSGVNKRWLVLCTRWPQASPLCCLPALPVQYIIITWVLTSKTDSVNTHQSRNNTPVHAPSYNLLKNYLTTTCRQPPFVRRDQPQTFSHHHFHLSHSPASPDQLEDAHTALRPPKDVSHLPDTPGSPPQKQKSRKHSMAHVRTKYVLRWWRVCLCDQKQMRSDVRDCRVSHSTGLTGTEYESEAYEITAKIVLKALWFWKIYAHKIHNKYSVCPSLLQPHLKMVRQIGRVLSLTECMECFNVRCEGNYFVSR